MSEVATIGELWLELDSLIKSGVPVDTGVSVIDHRGNIRRVLPRTLALRPGFGVTVKTGRP